MKALSGLSRSFLDSTPQGVSLEPISSTFSESSILISGSQGREQEGNVELARTGSNNDARSGPSSNTTHDGRDLDYDKPIEILTEWLAEMGWQVKWYSSGDYIDAASLPDRLITITRRQIPRHRYYSLLHECSHVELLAGPPESRRGEPHGYLDLWYSNVDERTLRHRVAVVMDEIAAWENGVRLAQRLGLGIDVQKYRDFRNRNLKSYFEWALEREGEEPEGP